MSKLNKIFTCSILLLLLISSCVIATDSNLMVTSPTPDTTLLTAPNDSVDSVAIEDNTVQELNEDLYVYNTEYCSIGDNVNGNVFASTKKLLVNPRINGGIISGDLFAIASELNIESDVLYSNSKDKNGNNLIDKVNSKSIINGNVYALSEYFTLEAGSEIHGDLYVMATSVNIEQDSIIEGNLYVYADNFTFNGQLTGSAYIYAPNFNMNYYAYIGRDLYLNSENATLSGVIYRNAFISSKNTLLTNSDFITYQNLSINSAKDFTFSGEIQGNANINSESITFKNTNENSNIKCTIKGNLNYASKNDTAIPDGVVIGEISSSTFEDKTSPSFNITNKLVSLFTFIFYVIAIVFLSKLIAPKALEKLPQYSVNNLISSFGLGLASLFVILLLFALLCLSGIGITTAFVLAIAYLFVLALALPLLVLDIANILKLKWNIYIKVLVISFVLYLISLIPVVGSIVIFIAIFTGIGRFFLPLFNKQNK